MESTSTPSTYTLEAQLLSLSPSTRTHRQPRLQLCLPYAELPHAGQRQIHQVGQDGVQPAQELVDGRGRGEAEVLQVGGVGAPGGQRPRLPMGLAVWLRGRGAAVRCYVGWGCVLAGERNGDQIVQLRWVVVVGLLLEVVQRV